MFEVHIKINFNGRDISDGIYYSVTKENLKDARELAIFWKKKFEEAEVSVLKVKRIAVYKDFTISEEAGLTR